jgi:hypothetical protein
MMKQGCTTPYFLRHFYAAKLFSKNQEQVMSFTKDRDGTIKDESGNIIFFSYERFLTDICEGDNCFMCGASPKDKEFNEEHVIPKWVLRKYGLFKQAITLPNGVSLRYDKYTVSCCKKCNSYLGATIEEPIRKATEGER